MEAKQRERFKEAKRSLKEMQKSIAPLNKKKEKSAPSTRGEWISGVDVNWKKIKRENSKINPFK